MPSNRYPRSLTCQPHCILRLCDLTGRGTQSIIQSSPHAILCRPLENQVTVSQLHMCACRLSGLTVRHCRERRPQRLTERGQRGAPGGLWRAGRCGAESAVLSSAGLLLRCWSGRGHWSRALPHCAAPILSAGDHESVESKNIFLPQRQPETELQILYASFYALGAHGEVHPAVYNHEYARAA